MMRADDIDGFRAQEALLVKKLNAFRKSLAITADASQKFSLDIQIQQVEAELADLRSRMYGISVNSGSPILRDMIEKLNIQAPMGRLHLVNCDREKISGKFWDAFDEFEEQHFQFYFLNACGSQQPESFSERMVYELMEEELEEDYDAIYMDTYGTEKDERIRIRELPVGRNLRNSQRKMIKYFAEQLNMPGKDMLSFLQSGSPALRYSYVVSLFHFNWKEWKPFYPEYFEWIIQTFCAGNNEFSNRFLFFFVVYMENAHQSLRPEQKAIREELQQLTGTYNNTALFCDLSPLEKGDAVDWFREIEVFNKGEIEEVLNALAAGLPAEKQKQFQQLQKLDMTDMERLQQLVYDVYKNQL
jgi:hypothetical protein